MAYFISNGSSSQYRSVEIKIKIQDIANCMTFMQILKMHIWSILTWTSYPELPIFQWHPLTKGDLPDEVLCQLLWTFVWVTECAARNSSTWHNLFYKRYIYSRGGLELFKLIRSVIEARLRHVIFIFITNILPLSVTISNWNTWSSNKSLFILFALHSGHRHS